MDTNGAQRIAAKATSALAYDKDKLAAALANLRAHVATEGEYILFPGNMGDHSLAARRYRKQVASQVIDPNARSNDTVREAKIEEACQLNPDYHAIVARQREATNRHQEFVDAVEEARAALKNEQIGYGLLAAALTN